MKTKKQLRAEWQHRDPENMREQSERLAREEFAKIAARYSWRNDTGEDWQRQTAEMIAAGFKLAPAEYHIPHWLESMTETTEGRPPAKLYVYTPQGPREMTSHLDCYVASLGYPVYFNSGAGADHDERTRRRFYSRRVRQGSGQARRMQSRS